MIATKKNMEPGSLKDTKYTKKERIEDKLDIVADFPVWLDMEAVYKSKI
jgi:hypothetical protein